VEEAVPPTQLPGRLAGSSPGKERKALTLLEIKVSAATEEEAYGKAETMLAASRPPSSSKQGIRPPKDYGYGEPPALADDPRPR
jgi:hypothetical protein